MMKHLRCDLMKNVCLMLRSLKQPLIFHRKAISQRKTSASDHVPQSLLCLNLLDTVARRLSLLVGRHVAEGVLNVVPFN